MTLPARPLRVFYVCHDGDLFGSQQSLALMVAHAREILATPIVSIARPGPLNERLAAVPGVMLTTHRRLQWFKHDARTGVQRAGDVAGLLAAAWPRAQALARLMRAHRADLVHTNSLVSLEGALAARLAGLPHVWHARELFTSDNPKLQPTLGRLWTGRLIEALSTRVIAISQAVAAQFSTGRSHRRLDVIPNAVTLDAAPSVPDACAREPGRLRIGYVGRLTAGKRFDDLLEALSRLDAGVELWAAGKFVDAPYEGRVRERIQALGLSERVSLQGVFPDLTTFYASVDVLALPSKDEPFGRALIEAMAAGLPCVGADSGGIPEIIEPGRTGWLYPCGDIDALAARLAACANDPSLRETLGHNARRAVAERFTIEAQMPAIRACYDAAMASGRR